MLDFLCLGAVGSDTMTGFEMLSNTVAMAKFWPPPAVRTPPEDAINVCFPGLQQDTFLRRRERERGREEEDVIISSVLINKVVGLTILSRPESIPTIPIKLVSLVL